MSGSVHRRLSPSELARRQAEAAIGQAIISLREHHFYWTEIESIVALQVRSVFLSEEAKNSQSTASHQGIEHQ